MNSLEPPTEIVIYPSRAKMALALLGSMALVAGGIWIGASGMAREIATERVILASYIGVPFFAVCGLYAAYRLAVRRPALVIDASGITDAASAAGAGHLRWDEIDRLVRYESSGQRMLGIVPRDLDGFLARQSVRRRWLARINTASGFAPLNIPQVGLSMPVDELAHILHTRYGVEVEEMRRI